MNKVLAAIVVLVAIAGFAWMFTQDKDHAFVINHLSDGGAFSGEVHGSYSIQGRNLVIKVDTWKIRFGVNNQVGGTLDSVFFELAFQKPGGWSRGIRSEPLILNRYIHAGHDVLLEDIRFTIPVENDLLESNPHAWLVATYSSRHDDRVGFNHGHDKFYLFSAQPR
jgi:hypothetical protein